MRSVLQPYCQNTHLFTWSWRVLQHDAVLHMKRIQNRPESTIFWISSSERPLPYSFLFYSSSFPSIYSSPHRLMWHWLSPIKDCGEGRPTAAHLTPLSLMRLHAHAHSHTRALSMSHHTPVKPQLSCSLFQTSLASVFPLTNTPLCVCVFLSTYRSTFILELRLLNITQWWYQARTSRVRCQRHQPNSTGKSM